VGDDKTMELLPTEPEMRRAERTFGDNIEVDLREMNVRVLTGFSRRKIGIIGGFL
jgi:hypothetical protein